MVGRQEDMPKYESKFSLGSVESIRPEAEGSPGKRTFRLAVKSGSASASLWLEKEQLQQVASYIHQVAESLSEDSLGSARDAPEGPWSGDARTFDFKIGQLSMGHDAAPSPSCSWSTARTRRCRGPRT
ncbi:MAG: DUF3090 family protein [SAR202 cluster bacterium]|nr:DUF3090 family protein [SAR202 cluster bacterium]